MAAGTLPRLPRSARGLSRPRSDCLAAHGPAVFHVKQPACQADVPAKGGRGRRALSPALAGAVRESVIGELGAWAAHRTLGPEPDRDEEPGTGPAGPGLPRPWPCRTPSAPGPEGLSTPNPLTLAGSRRWGRSRRPPQRRAGVRSAPAIWGAALVTRTAVPNPHRSTGSRDSHRPRTSQQANEATDPSAGTAAWCCSGPDGSRHGPVIQRPGRPRHTTRPAGKAQASGPERGAQRPAPAVRRWNRWSAGPDAVPGYGGRPPMEVWRDGVTV